MDKIIKFVCEELKNDFSGHDFDHAKRVYNNALNISKTISCNERIVFASCYLHDCVDRKLFSDVNYQISKITFKNHIIHISKRTIISPISISNFNSL